MASTTPDARFGKGEVVFEVDLEVVEHGLNGRESLCCSNIMILRHNPSDDLPFVWEVYSSDGYLLVSSYDPSLHLPPGVYFVELLDATRREVLRLVAH